MDHFIFFLNDIGHRACDYAGVMFAQTAILVAVLFVVDRIIQKRINAIFSLLDVDVSHRQVAVASNFGAADRTRLLGESIYSHDCN